MSLGGAFLAIGLLCAKIMAGPWDSSGRGLSGVELEHHKLWDTANGRGLVDASRLVCERFM